MVSLFLTLNIFHNFFYCFSCWLWTGHCLLGMEVQVVISLCRSVSFDQGQIIHWSKLKNSIRKCFPKLHVFSSEIFLRIWASKTKKLKKMLRKSQTSNETESQLLKTLFFPRAQRLKNWIYFSSFSYLKFFSVFIINASTIIL